MLAAVRRAEPRQPGISDLAGVWKAAAARRMARRPRPAFEIPEARRADDNIIGKAHDRKRHSASGVSPSQGGLDVAGGFGLAARNWTPLVERGIVLRGRNQPVDVTLLQRFQPNVLTL